VGLVAGPAKICQVACWIVPPYILKSLAEHGDAALRARALETLELSGRLAGLRMALAGRLETIARGKGERRTVCDAGHHQVLPGKVVRREGGPAVEDAAANEAYENAGITYDFFERVFGRRSIDGEDMRLLSSVHYSKYYDNAFWDGEQMVYGDGDGVVFGSFTGALDVIAHELGHGVTQMTCGLAYHGEPGALNESISDVFGSMVKQWHRKQTVHEADWLIGDELIKDKKFGKALRSLKAPGTAYDNIFMGGKDPQPAHYRHYDHGRDDDGGVHVNSGIPNHAFYLLAMELGGHSWERAGRIWYEAATGELGTRCSFGKFAERTMGIAQSAFGDDANAAVTKAWHGVGISTAVAADARS